MKHLVWGSIALCAVALPATASEFAFQGAEFSVQGYHNTADAVFQSWTTGSLGGSAEFALGPNGLILQGDVSLQGYDMSWQDYYLASLGAHVGYDLGWGASVGAFAVAEVWDDATGEAGVGGEIAGETNNFFYEAYGLYLFDPLKGTGWEQTHVEATGGYNLGNGLGVELGVHYAIGDLRFTDRMWQGIANVRYDLGDDIRVEAGYVYSDSGNDFWDSQGLNLTLTKVIGGGTSFSRRNYLAVHNGY